MIYTLKELQEKAIEYIDHGQFHRAFLTLWQIIKKVDLFSDAREKVGKDSKCLAWVESKDEDYEDVKFLGDDGLFYGKNIRDIIIESPLEGLWVLDRYLYAARRYDNSKTTLVDIELKRIPLEYWVVQRKPRKNLERSPAGQLQDALKYFPSHGVIPRNISGLNIYIEPVDSLIARELEKLSVEDDIEVYFSHFSNGSELVVDEERNKNGAFVAIGITKEQERIDEAINHLSMASKKGAKIVVFPELSVTESMRNAMAEWMVEKHKDTSIIWIVAGSFHEQMSSDTSKWINRTYSIGPMGTTFHMHTKINAFGRENETHEDIREWRDIWLLETPLGLVATPICLDYCQSNSNAAASDVMNELFLDLCLVPAMDKKNGAHIDKAKRLHREKGTSSIVAIQHPEDHEEDISFAVGFLKRVS